ncbi:MAG: hypothetical protein ACOVO0_03145 [Burkholderiaceae bacterium]|jgi:hypothetical protein
MSTLRYTYVSPQLPENKLRLYPTQVINIIGGPGCDKSLFTSAIVLNLHLRGKTVETIPDFAKTKVWLQDQEALRNQWAIAQHHFELLEVLDGQVRFLVTECSLPQLLYYNENYADNICDVGKTHQQILDWHGQFNNVNVMVRRNPNKRYVRSGRLQDEAQAVQIDEGLQALLIRENIPFTLLDADPAAIQAFAETLGQ